jgi:hypothetical protein
VSDDLRNEDLAAYQAQLLDILHAGTSGPDMIDAILLAAGPLAPALSGLDARLVEVAADLTRTWGRPSIEP